VYWASTGLSVSTVDLMLAIVLAAGVVVGLRQGLIRQVLALLAFYLSLVLAAQYYPHVSRTLGDMFGGDQTARSAISLAVLFVVLAVILNWLIYYIYRDTALPNFPVGDRLAGAWLGLAWSWVLAGVALTIVNFALSISWQAWEPDRLAVVDMLRQSDLAPLVTGPLPMLYRTLRPWLPMGLPAPFVL
jgi:uncharacterized membrane protein required for colicin V production